MKWLYAIFAVLVLVFLAATMAPRLMAQDSVFPIDPETVLASLGGISLAAWFLVEFAGKWINFGPAEISKKPLAAVVVALALGVISKLSSIGFAQTKWPVLILALVITGIVVPPAINKTLKGVGIQIPNVTTG